MKRFFDFICSLLAIILLSPVLLLLSMVILIDSGRPIVFRQKRVGPRPLIPEEEEIRSLREASGVYRMRPGVTGLAQVNGRDLLTAEQKVAYDAYYVEHHTLFMDIRILFQTIAAVLTGKGFAEGGELQHHGEQGEDDSEIE